MPEKHVQAVGSTLLCSLRQSEGKKGRYLKGVDPCGVERNVVSVPNSRGSGKGSAKEQGVAVPARERLRENVTDRRAGDAFTGGLPFPASGPSHSHAAPAPPWAPPASGTATTGLGSKTDNFLLPDAQPGSNSPSTDEAASTRVAPSSRPTLLPLLSLLPQTELAKPRLTRELSRYLESTGFCSLWRSVLSTVFFRP